MKKFLIELIVLYVASLIIFALVAAIIPGVEATAGNIFLYSLIMPAVICIYTALENGYSDDADDESILF